MGKSMSNEQINKPLYTVQFKVVGAGVEIRLNDIPIHLNDAPGTTSSEIQVPQYIFNGLNELKVRTFCLEEDNNQYRNGAYVIVSLHVKEKGAPSSQSKELLQFKLNPTLPEKQYFDGSLDFENASTPKLLNISNMEITASRSIQIATSFPKWSWTEGQQLEKNDTTRNSLLNSYKNIYNVLKDSNETELRKIYHKAASELATAYHYDDIENGYTLLSATDLMSDSRWSLLDMNQMLDQFEYKLEVLADGKLARLIDEEGYSPIVYMRDDELVAMIPFYWYLNKNNEWVMIR